MNWKKIFPIIGIILFIYILIKLDISEIINEIKNADLFFLIVAFIFVAMSLLIQTLKWFVIAQKQKIKIPFFESFKVNLITNFYSLVTPSKIGSLVRINYLKKYSKNVGKPISNFVLDKIMDLSSIFFMAIIFSIIFRNRLNFIPIEIFIIVFLLMVLFTFIFVNKKRSAFMLRFFYKKTIPKKLQEKTKLTFNSFYENMPKKRDFVLFFILNIWTWINIYAITFFVGKSLGIELSFLYFLAILPIGTLVAMIPISIGGLGTREAVLIKLFGLFGISATKVFSMSIISLVIVSFIPSIIASFLIIKNKGK